MAGTSPLDITDKDITQNSFELFYQEMYNSQQRKLLFRSWDLIVKV